MASGKQSRRRRREAEARAAIPTRRPPARRRGSTRAPAPPPVRTARGRQASPKVLVAAAAALVLIGVAVGLAVVLTRGGSSSSASVPARGSLANALPGGRDAQRLFSGIGQHSNVLGPPSAPVTLVEYIDVQCPYCRQFETEVMPSIVKRYVRTGKLRVQARPLAFIGPASELGRNALIAAGLQGKAFELAQILYDNQGIENTGWLDDTTAARAAESVPGLNPRELFAQRGSAGVAAEASAFDDDASADGVNGTPTIYVGRTGAQGTVVPLRSPTDETTLLHAIDAALS